MMQLLGIRRVCSGVLCAGIAGALIAAGGCATPHAVLSQATQAKPAPLSSRVRAMASGTRTVSAGLQPLDSVSGGDSTNGALVYVPTQCVGTRRVPLVVLLHGSAMTGYDMLTFNDRKYRPLFENFADSNGVILLAPSARDPSGWIFSLNSTEPSPDELDVDAAIHQVLRHYAIDPARIALVGVSGGATVALLMGTERGDLFSHVIAFSPFATPAQLASLPRPGTPAIFIGGGLEDEALSPMRVVVPWLRKEGYTVTYVEDPNGHYLPPERADAGLRWLIRSWEGKDVQKRESKPRS